MPAQIVTNAVTGLLVKYRMQPIGSKKFVSGWFLADEREPAKCVPLQSWRYNRKFVELRRIIEGKTVEDPKMFRFCALGDKQRWTLDSLIYRECDLCEFLGGNPIVSVHAVLNGTAGSIIAKLAGGIICSVEVGAHLQTGRALIDRHEIIARRGVASDIVVDAQIPQNSIYTFTNSGGLAYRDVDYELFGLDEPDIELVRAIFDACKNPELENASLERHWHLTTVLEAVHQSNQTRKKINL